VSPRNVKRLIYALPGNEDFADLLALRGNWERRPLMVHRFPDGESLVTVAEPEPDAEALLVCTLNHPDPKLLPLLMAADTLHELGAVRVILVAPYLAYMRQDVRFHPGEAVSSRILAGLLDAHFDTVITIEPHLHRHASLAEAGLRHGFVASAAPAIAAWISNHVRDPVIIGPDEESRQWATQIAHLIRVPVAIASKQRNDDAHVTVRLPNEVGALCKHRTPVLVDDIISSGHTMTECTHQLARLGLHPPLCVAVHGLLGATARERILAAGAVRIVTTNSIDCPYARIDISGSLAEAIDAIDHRPHPAAHSSAA